MKVLFQDLSRIHNRIRPQLDKAISSVLDRSDYILGDSVAEFEKLFSGYIGVKHGIGCSSGTDALELALRSLNLDSDDEVLIPCNTWVSAAAVTRILGAKPVFVDIDPLTLNIDFDHLKSRISNHSKVIIATHLFGRPLDMEGLMDIAEEKNLLIIEDCSHAHGASFSGKRLGSFGIMSCFSFYPTKNLGALGDAGMVLTNSGNYNEKLRVLRNHGQEKRDHHIELSRNYRMDDIQASVLNVKLNYLDEWNRERRSVAQQYIDGLSGIEGIDFQYDFEDNHVFHQFVIQVDDRIKLINSLKENGVETKIHYPNIIPSMRPYLESDYDKNYSKGLKASERILSLPIYPRLTDGEADYVLECIKSCF